MTSLMKVIRSLHNLPKLPMGSVVTIGNFDGVHRGHQLIIRQLLDAATTHAVPAVVMLFEPQPREFFDPGNAPPRLMPLREKLEALRALGVDYALCVAFDQRFRALGGEQFIQKVLLDGLGVRHLVVGDDFRFGCDRTGNYALLQAWGVRHGFVVEQTATVEIDGLRVSSTRVRETLLQGRFDDAAYLLGRRYGLSGRVVQGQQLGRQLGVPTANLVLRHVPPLSGVYVVGVHLPDGRLIDGVANVGYRPTVAGRELRLEVHLFDFSESLYGQRIHVDFRHFLRGEQRFADVEALRRQIERDLSLARAMIASRAGG